MIMMTNHQSTIVINQPQKIWQWWRRWPTKPSCCERAFQRPSEIPQLSLRLRFFLLERPWGPHEARLIVIVWFKTKLKGKNSFLAQHHISNNTGLVAWLTLLNICIIICMVVGTLCSEHPIFGILTQNRTQPYHNFLEHDVIGRAGAVWLLVT